VKLKGFIAEEEEEEEELESKEKDGKSMFATSRKKVEFRVQGLLLQFPTTTTRVVLCIEEQESCVASLESIQNNKWEKKICVVFSPATSTLPSSFSPPAFIKPFCFCRELL
jgi:hypothetical protein